MKNKIFVLTIVVLMLLTVAFMLVGCSFFDKTSDNDNSSDNESLVISSAVKSEYKAGFNYASSVVVDKEDVPDDERDVALENNEDYDVKYKKVKATYSYNDLCAMGADNEILYPGAMVDITNDRYTPLYLERAPLTISVNLESMLDSTGKLYSVVENPNLSSVRTGIREIVADNVGVGSSQLPAKISMDIREVSNENEFYMNVGFGLQVSKLGIAENFSYGKVKRQTNMVIVLKQEYYTVDVDYTGARGLFARSLSNSDINQQLNGKIPAYVSSVSYGRIAFITIQTNYSKSEITNALSAAWGKMSDNPGTSATKKLSAEFDSSLSSIANDSDTSINYYVYGGGVGIDGALGNITTNSVETICNLFESFNAADSVGLPISYKLRDLSGSLVDVYNTDEYTVKEISYIPRKIMDWSYLGNLLQSGEMFTRPSIKLDLSAMVDYSNITTEEHIANRTITIPSNVTEFTLIGPNNATSAIVYQKLSLRVSFRKSDNPLKITLSKVSFSADTNSSESNGRAIFSDSNAQIELEIDEDIYIEGVNNNAIEGNNLVISGAGILTVKGGAGVNNTENGGNGTDGYIGIKAQSLEVNLEGKLYVYGGNGGNGYGGISYDRNSTSASNHVDGGNGGNGGNGGAAISVDNLTLMSGCIFEATGGNGGFGGAGGNGQGSNAKNNGWSGNGGNGGNGGCGGNALVCKNLIVKALSNSDRLILTGGVGGNGGNAGHGGNAARDVSWGIDFSDHSGNGGNGGNGGDGGYAFYSETENTVSSSVSLTINSGVGGNGGTLGERGSGTQYLGQAGQMGQSGAAKNTNNLIVQ